MSVVARKIHDSPAAASGLLCAWTSQTSKTARHQIK